MQWDSFTSICRGQNALTLKKCVHAFREYQVCPHKSYLKSSLNHSSFFTSTNPSLPQEACCGSVLLFARDLSTVRQHQLCVNHQPAAFHWLRSPGVHLPGQEARLWESAHHHWCLLGALWDLGGEDKGHCTRHRHTGRIRGTERIWL